MPPQGGKLLVAKPALGDPNFDRTVVFLTEYSEHGAVGFVLNRRIDVKVGDLIGDFDNFQGRIYHGGPVQNDSLFFVHRKGDLIPGSHRITKEISWGGDFQPLREMIEMDLIGPDDLLFFLGYSGWGAGQLDQEIEDQSWWLFPESSADWFNRPNDDLWAEVLRHQGDDYALWLNSPSDPNLN